MAICIHPYIMQSVSEISQVRKCKWNLAVLVGGTGRNVLLPFRSVLFWILLTTSLRAIATVHQYTSMIVNLGKADCASATKAGNFVPFLMG